MTINLTELRDEPLGKHPIQAAVCCFAFPPRPRIDAQQDVVAADYESCFTFDVDGLSDEALDSIPRYAAFTCCQSPPCR